MRIHTEGTHTYYVRALASDVLVVASVNRHTEGCGDWAAYIGAVPGVNHDREWGIVRESGDKLDPELARVLFPTLATDQSIRWRK